jgi:hypothetical protein
MKLAQNLNLIFKYTSIFPGNQHAISQWGGEHSPHQLQACFRDLLFIIIRDGMWNDDPNLDPDEMTQQVFPDLVQCS